MSAQSVTLTSVPRVTDVGNLNIAYEDTTPTIMVGVFQYMGISHLPLESKSFMQHSGQ
jgi:hypothetical protein